MALTHAGFAIPGVHEDIRFGQWDEQKSLISVFGNFGAVAHLGGYTSRTITIPILIYNNYTQSQLSNFLQDLYEQGNAIGTLVETTGLARSFQYVLFEQFVPDTDVIPPNSHLGYSIHGELNFRQLRT